MYAAAEQQIHTVLNNVDGAIDFVINSERTHPNRIDVCRNSGASTAGSQPNPFGTQQPGLTGNPFGAPSQPAPQPASRPAFGAPSAPSGAFGQPTALGQKSNPFGAPTFGTPSQPVGSFGQPSALGQKSNPFGAPSVAAPATTTAPFSSFSQPANPFGQQPATSNPFGTPSQPAQANPFGQQQPVTSNTFGAPSQPAQANPFGQPSSQSQAPWAQSTPAPSNPFSNTSPSPFGVPSPAKNPFGTQSSSTSSQPNPFGAPSQPVQANPFGNPSLNQANPLGRPSSSGTGALNGNTGSELDPQSGRLRTWHGKPVVYRDEIPGTERTGGWKNGRREMIWERIWFPTGPPRENLDTEMIDKSVYEDPKLKETYMAARETGSFPGGLMPLMPPKREWCEWDF
jgi:nucleoporin NUP42